MAPSAPTTTTAVVTIQLDGTERLVRVTAAPLTPEAFAPFGDVVQNPRPGLHPSVFFAAKSSCSSSSAGHGSTTPTPGSASSSGSGSASIASSHDGQRQQHQQQQRQEETKIPHDPIVANQGSAIKYQHPTRPRDLYAQAPSGVPSSAVVNMFVCAAQKVEPERDGGVGRSGGGSRAGIFPVRVLERHPFTSQTFVPLSHDRPPAAVDGETEEPDVRYLVIVAPSLSPNDADAGFAVPSSPSSSSTSTSTTTSSSSRPPFSPLPPPPPLRLPGRGLPDLRHLRAFVATGSQAVTYGPGTWHAPMVALGAEGSVVDFFVVQFANGVGSEDCQEVVIEPVDKVVVRLPSKLWEGRTARTGRKRRASKL